MNVFREHILVIPDAQTESNIVDLNSETEIALVSLGFIAPASGQTVTVHVAAHLSGTFVPLKSNGNNITLPDSSASVITVGPFGALKLVAGGAVSGAKSYTLLAK